MTNLAISIVCCASLVVCAEYAHPSPKSLVGAVRWASITTLLGAFVYLLWCVWERYQRKVTRGREEYSGVEPDGNSSAFEPGIEVQAQVVLYPELTIASVWVYVYGVGLLLFVSLYCLSGIEMISSCWWILGMTPLAVDELMSSGMERVWVGVLMLLIYTNTSLLWFVDGGAYENLLTFEPWYILCGITLPVTSTFIFFSLRSTVRSTIRDVTRLCGLAMPFMVVLALCSLAWTAQSDSLSEEPARRGLAYAHNRTFHSETPARFYATAVVGEPERPEYLHALGLLLSPLAAAAILRQLIASVMGGFTSEFVSALLLVLSVRLWVLRGAVAWPVTCIGMAGVVFVLILCIRRS